MFIDVRRPPDWHEHALSFTMMQSESCVHACTSLMVGVMDVEGCALEVTTKEGVGLAATVGSGLVVTDGKDVTVCVGVGCPPLVHHASKMAARAKKRPSRAAPNCVSPAAFPAVCSSMPLLPRIAFHFPT